MLFGSCVGGSFVVDTVFVVDDWIDHDAGSYKALLCGMAPDAYWDVTLKPRYSNESGRKVCLCLPGEGLSWRLYFGATYNNQVDGMFSFVPCTLSEDTPNGFAHPSINLTGTVNPRLVRNYRRELKSRLSDVAELWHRVVDQAESQGLSLGVSFEVPTQRVDV